MPDFGRLVGPVAEFIATGGLGRPAAGGRPLDAVCVAFAAELPVDGVSMSVLSSRADRETVGVSDLLANLIEDEQFGLGSGPCYEAFSRGGPVLVADIDDPAVDGWPEFGAALAGTPVRAVFAFPLQLGAVTVGAVDTYRTRPGLPDAGELADLLRAVDLLALAVAGAGALLADAPGASLGPPRPRPGLGGGTELGADDLDGPSRPGGRSGWEHVLDALPSDRARVHQATGMVVGQLGGSVQQALARISAHAFSTDRAITEVAADIVDRRLVLHR